MQINITTFAGRKEQYVHATLDSLLASDWADTGHTVNLIVGSEDESHLRDYVDHPAVHVVPWDMQTLPNLRWNCTLNKMRALRFGGEGPTVICEDDVVFPPDWLAALGRATAELGDRDYVLSLFAGARFDEAPLVAGMERVKEYPTLVMQGAQAVYYPTRKLRRELAMYLREHLQLACGDELIGRFAREYAALYTTRECLVDNIGAVSCFH